MVTPLDSNDVDLWILDLDTVEAKTLEQYAEILPECELQQEQRFRFPGGRERYRCTRALARTVLSHYAGCGPGEWVFAANNYGKPRIAEPAGLPLHFNLSHSGRLVVCAVASDAELGVDVERLRELPKAVELSRRFFAPSEATAVAAASCDCRSREFLRHWTFKESYVKARGEGLIVPLAGFFFSLSYDARPAIGFADPESDAPQRWQLAELRYGACYQLALAVRRRQSDPLHLRVRRTIPLQWTETAQLLPDDPLYRWDLDDMHGD